MTQLSRTLLGFGDGVSDLTGFVTHGKCLRLGSSCAR